MEEYKHDEVPELVFDDENEMPNLFRASWEGEVEIVRTLLAENASVALTAEVTSHALLVCVCTHACACSKFSEVTHLSYHQFCFTVVLE